MMRIVDAIYRPIWAVALTLLAYALFFEKPFLSYENLPFPANVLRVRAGAVMPLTVHRRSSSDVARFYAVTHELRSVTDPSAPPILMPSGFVTIDPGCNESTSEFNQVPIRTRPDTYRVHGLAIVDGTLRTFTVPWSSQPFEVIE